MPLPHSALDLSPGGPLGSPHSSWQPCRHQYRRGPAAGQWRGCCSANRATRCHHGHHPNLILPLLLLSCSDMTVDFAGGGGRSLSVSYIIAPRSVAARLQPWRVSGVRSGSLYLLCVSRDNQLYAGRLSTHNSTIQECNAAPRRPLGAAAVET